jgi:hypothetical protein
MNLFSVKVRTAIALVGFCIRVALWAEAVDSSNSASTTNNPAASAPSWQPLTAEQAKAAHDRKQEPKPGPGTWRYVTISVDPWGTTHRTNYLFVSTNNQRFERIEETVRSTNRVNSVKTYLRIKNSEGSWALHKKIAILTPPENGSDKSASKDDDFDPTEKEFESLAVYSGERFAEGGRVLLRVAGELNAEARRKAVDLLVKRLKKEKDFPFFARMLISTMKGKIADILPARFESVLEEQSGLLILDRLFDKDGRLTSEDYYWEHCPDFPPENFSIPENLQRVRPKTVKDARELEKKTHAEEAKSAK